MTGPEGDESPSGAPAGDPVPARRRTRWVFLIAAAVLALDAISKAVVVATVVRPRAGAGARRPVLPGRGTQHRRRLLLRRGRHDHLHRDRGRGGRDHRADRAAAPVGRLGGRARAGPRRCRWATSSTGCPGRRARCAARVVDWISRVRSRRRGSGRSSTWPTRRSSAAASGRSPGARRVRHRRQPAARARAPESTSTRDAPTAPGPPATMGVVTSSAPGMRRAARPGRAWTGCGSTPALARLFGLSRTARRRAGRRRQRRRRRPAVRGKSDRMPAGTLARGGACRRRPVRPPAPPQPVPGLTDHVRRRRHRRGRQAGRASPRTRARAGTGPTVIGGARGATGYRVSTRGAAERQGVVHRLDAGTTGADGGRQERAGLHRCSRTAFRDRTVDKGYHALVQGHPDPSRGTIDAPDRPPPELDWQFAVVAGGRPERHPLRHARGVPRRRACSTSGWRPGGPTRSGCTWPRCGTRASGTSTYGADPTLAARLGLTRQWLHAVRLGLPHPADGRWVEFTSAYPADLAAALDAVGDPS